jgi:hypothetical protein
VSTLRLRAPGGPEKAKVAVGERAIAATLTRRDEGYVELAFAEPVTVGAGETLRMTLT